jgi:hypothetical protein
MTWLSYVQKISLATPRFFFTLRFLFMLLNKNFSKYKEKRLLKFCDIEPGVLSLLSHLFFFTNTLPKVIHEMFA